MHLNESTKLRERRWSFYRNSWWRRKEKEVLDVPEAGEGRSRPKGGLPGDELGARRRLR